MKNEQGVEIPCRFAVDEPVTWFAMNGNKIVSNWDPSVVFPEQGAIPPGAHQITISATPIGFSQHQTFKIKVTA